MKTTEYLDAVCNALNRTPGSLSLADTPQTIEEWDSLGHLTIVSTIDVVLGISPDDSELRSFKSIGELVAALAKRGALEQD